MAISYTTQYRPISTLETGADDPISVRAIRDMACSLNNAKRYAMAHKVRRHMAIPPCETTLPTGAETTEQLLYCFAPVFVPNGYGQFRVFVGAKRSAGSGSVRITIRCQERAYNGPVTIDSSYLSPSGMSNYFDFSLDDNYIGPAKQVRVVTDAGRLSHLFVTSTASDTSTKVKITTIDIAPELLDSGIIIT